MNVTLRRSIFATAVALAVLVLSACGPNFDAQTGEVYNPGTGVNDRSGRVDVLNALIVSGEDGSGTVVAGLVNNDEATNDSLTGVSGTGEDTSVKVNAVGPPVQIPADGMYQLADRGEISATGEQIRPGQFIELTFAFEHAESVQIEVPVVADTNEFSDVPLPAPARTP